MTHGTEHHLEHAEHAQHAAHDPFDKRVAMSMAITAAVLAFVSMLSHRAHNKTLQLQGEAIRIQSEATSARAKEFNRWNYFQTKKERGYKKEDNLEMARHLRHLLDNNKKHPIALLEEEHGDMPKAHPQKAKAAKKKPKKAPDDPAAIPGYWKSLAASYKSEAADQEKEARKFQKKAENLEHHAHDMLHESHYVHAQANRLDLGHLGLELALVLCSVAVLSKQRGFWYSGITVGILGALVSFTAYVPFLMGG
jgi:hypothetical protein